MKINFKEKIDSFIKENDVVLFMKGNANQPMCGFSAKVVAILNHYNVEFLDVDVLEDIELREGIKEYSNWPTIPQLYVKGEFIGGCDIAMEMMESGEMDKILASCKKLFV